ncbi:MAG: Hint domain-containing protein [Bdellovibrionota bacterium]
MKIFKSKNDGSTAFAALSAVTVLSFAALYTSRIASNNKREISQAEIANHRLTANEAVLNATSRFKAMMSNRKMASGQYLPVFYASNYYDPYWKIQLVGAEPKNYSKTGNGTSIQLNVSDFNKKDLKEANSVMAGNSSTTDVALKLTQLKLLQTNFTGPLATSVDVEVDSTEKIDNVDQKVYLRARVPLGVPQPSDPVLEISPAGANNFRSDLTSIPAGFYDLRVRGTGVIYNAKIMLGTDELGVVGGFQNGKISHNANNYLAKNEIIGTLSNKYLATASADDGTEDPEGDGANCKYVSASKTVSLSAIIYGPDTKTYVASVPIQLNVGSAAPSTEPMDYTAHCQKECPFIGPQDHTQWDNGFLNAHMIDNGFGDSSSAFVRDVDAQNFKVPSNRKLCINFELPAQLALKADGKMPADFWQLGGGTDRLQFADFYTYDMKTCKRKLLFKRGVCGCFADDTQITLGDGITQKAISSLTYEDTVWNPLLKRAFGIRRITRGPEKVPMIKITADGKSVSVTGKHPFPTKEGNKTAFSLSVGDSIRSASGDWVEVEQIDIEVKKDSAKDPVVWNVELDAPNEDEDAHHVLANGVVTGDYFIQVKLEQAR